MSLLLAEDAAMKSRLAGLTVSDAKNPTRPVDVWFRRPQKQFREARFPFITIDWVGEERDSSREHRGIVDPTLYPIDGYVADGLSSTEARAGFPIPINLIYQVSTHCRNPLHDRQLNRQLLSYDRLPWRFGWLDVGDDTTRRLDLLSVVPADYRDPDNKDVYRKVYTVLISSEVLEDYQPEHIKFVTPQGGVKVNSFFDLSIGGSPTVEESL